MTLQEIQRFCSADETRPALTKPWFIDEGGIATLVATDGRIIVWMDLPDSIGRKSLDRLGLGDPPNIADLQALWKNGTPVSIPILGPCLHCKSGQSSCRLCHQPCPCPECLGTGRTAEGTSKIKGRVLSNQYVNLISTIPGVVFVGDEAKTGAESLEPVPFMAPGSIKGLVMPMKPADFPG